MKNRADESWSLCAAFAAFCASMALVLLLAGCDSPPWEFGDSNSVLILPAAVIVPAGLEMKYDEEYAAKQNDCEALYGIGANMDRYYAGPTALVVQHATYSELQKGMLVIFINSAGWRSAGLIAGEVREGWYVAGVSSTQAAIVNEKNLIGYVVTAFTSDRMPQRY